MRKVESSDLFTVGKRICQERKERHLTQEQMALIMDISPSYLGAIERGQRPVSRNVLEKLHEVFNISYDYLIDGHTLSSSSISQYVKESTQYTTHHKLNTLLSISTPEERESCYNLIYTFLIYNRRRIGGLSNMAKAPKVTSESPQDNQSESSSLPDTNKNYYFHH